MKAFTTIATLLSLFLSFANAVYVTGNYGMCLTYVRPVAQEPVFFQRCRTREAPEQSNWVVTTVPGSGGAITICANGVNLCLTIVKDNKFGTYGILDYASDPNGPLTSQQFKQDPVNFRLVNLFTGTGLCVTNSAGLTMQTCGATQYDKLQPMYIYGPSAPNRAFSSSVDSEYESEDYGYYGNTAGYGAGSAISSFYPSNPSYSSLPYNYLQQSPYSHAVSPYYPEYNPYSSPYYSQYSHQTPYYNNPYNNYYPFYY